MSKRTISTTLITVLFSIVLFACAPPKVEKCIEIGGNETAFLVPLEGATKDSQSKFMSIEYLNSPEVKVATKRITLPQRTKKTGRFYWDVEWVTTMRVITVDRSPVTREWTVETDTGSNIKNDAIQVESKDSIGFNVGINITAMIKEEDAAKFLYFYAGKELSTIVDNNVRGTVSSILSREFGSRDLQHCKSDKKDIQKTLENEVIAKYVQFGITISNVGLVGGLDYDNPDIQTAINTAYIAEMNVIKAAQEKLEQDEVNKKNIATAEANRTVAEEFAKAQEAATKKISLDIEMIKAQALLKAADKWSGAMPANILPSGSQLLFGLNGAIK